MRRINSLHGVNVVGRRLWAFGTLGVGTGLFLLTPFSLSPVASGSHPFFHSCGIRDPPSISFHDLLFSPKLIVFTPTPPTENKSSLASLPSRALTHPEMDKMEEEGSVTCSSYPR